MVRRRTRRDGLISGQPLLIFLVEPLTKELQVKIENVERSKNFNTTGSRDRNSRCSPTGSTEYASPPF
jgi:hypothetical protein